MTKEQLAEQYALTKFPNAHDYDGRRTWESLCPLDRFEDAENAYKAGYEAAEPKWVSVEEVKPSTNNLVLVKCEKDYDGRIHAFCTMAIYVPKFTVLEEDLMGEDFWEQGDYNDVTGAYYAPEGWYEWQSEPDMNYKISATVTHWMPLPEKPQS